MRRYSNHHVELLRVLVASAGVQAIRVVQAYCLGRALAIDLPLGTYFLLIPIVLLVMLLPITVSGLGTSQVAFQYLFGQAGVAAPEAVALSILFVALGVVGNLPGSVLYAFDAIGPRARDNRETMKRVFLAAAVLALSTLAALWFAGQFQALLYTRPLRPGGSSRRAARYRALRPSPPRGLDRRRSARIRPDATHHLAGD